MASLPSGSDGGNFSRAFELLHPTVQRWVWEQGWDELKDVQERAIISLTRGESDVIISAATAGGKTEAAFLPICSAIARRTEKKPGSTRGVQALYVSPLKALINDQWGRLDALCEKLEIPVHRWHGDVSAGAKRKLVENPSGILLITPESLEANFVVRGTMIPKIFATTSWAVIDELHAFIGTERGMQLQALLHRLEHTLQRPLRRVGLSATLGEMSLAAEYLRPTIPGRSPSANQLPHSVEIITSESSGTEIKLRLQGYVNQELKGADDTEDPTASPRGREVPRYSGADPESQDPSDHDIPDHLFRTLRGASNLVFANSRSNVESIADELRIRCENDRIPQEFWPHHGNLSRELRTDVEGMLKARNAPVTVICTSTLELGIDIGQVQSVAQIGCPPSVASLRQRLGRSGRRGEPAVLRLYITEHKLDPQSSLFDEIRTGLFQTVAMIELLAERWFEPPDLDAIHASTLVQQILSVIAQHGGVRAAELFALLSGNGPFHRIDQELFVTILRGLGQHDLITQMSEGTLLLGQKGERVVNHYSFFTAFMTPQEYRLVAQGRTLGSMPMLMPVYEGLLLIFAGRRWTVISVDPDQAVIEVVPAVGGNPPIFNSRSAKVHDRVRQKMFELYCGTYVPRYLDDTATRLFMEGRENFARHRLAERRIVRYGDGTLLLPWTGDKILQTLEVQLQSRGVSAAVESIGVFVRSEQEERVKKHLSAIASEPAVDARELAETVEILPAEKFDEYLAAPGLLAAYAARELNVLGARGAASVLTAR
jgi:ATP-dependent helicase Lhr and Lhr-like helicase